MATQKRRVIYLSDEQWDAARWNASKHPLSISAYIGSLVMKDRHRVAEEVSLEKEFGHLRELDVQPFQQFQPAPKPGRK